MAASPLVAVGEDDAGAVRPLRLVGTWLYLDRYWREERQVAADLRALGDEPPAGVDDRRPRRRARRGCSPAQTDSRQRLAAAAAVLRRLAVVAGGPGTGKTTTVARIVALLAEQAAAAGAPPPLVALAAPTGKAAARLEEAVHEEAATLDVDDADPRAAARARAPRRCTGCSAGGPDSHSRFRHDRGNRLPHDVVIVDETSMVSLSLMARLVEAVRPDARLVLVGDPGQLTSIEAGAVLGDIVGPATDGLLHERRRARAARRRRPARTSPPRTRRPARRSATGSSCSTASTASAAASPRVAEAIRRGDADAVLEALARRARGRHLDPGRRRRPGAQTRCAPVRERRRRRRARGHRGRRAGAAREAIEALGAFRLLCAHRRGPHGVATWTARIEGWLAEPRSTASPPTAAGTSAARCS